MSEDAPQFPLGGEPQEQQPVVDEAQETTEELDGAAVEAMQIPVTDASVEDTRQDPIKGETVGRAAMEAENLRLQKPLEPGYSNINVFDGEHAKNLHRIMSDPNEDDIANLDEEAAATSSNVALLERNIQKYEGSDPERAQQFREELESSYKPEYERAIAAATERVKEKGRLAYEEYIPRRKEEISKRIEPFEKLYDLAPEIFAQMPTSEFVSATNEFRQAEEYLQEKSLGLEWMEIALEELEERLQNKQTVYYDETMHNNNIFRGNIAGFINEANKALVSDNREIQDISEADQIWKDIETKYKNIFIGTYDKSPRQIVEQCIEVTRDFVSQVAEQLQEALRQKNEFLKKYGIKTESEESETATAPSESVN